MKRKTWLTTLAAGIAIALVFIALNYRAYDGFFQDDELDNLSWAGFTPASEFATALAKPLFDTNNFRPVGSAYFAVMKRNFGEDFPPYITPIFAVHLLNALLIFLLTRKLGVNRWGALAAVAFFTWSAGAFDAYWKPMYVFDLFCTFFCLLSVLFYASRRYVLSFLAFWCAYKAKELGVMVPVALLAWEHWLGDRRYLRLAPFFLASLSFGLQGLLFNPNKNNDYTFRFTWRALAATVPFYAKRFFLFPWSGLLLLPLLLLRDRKVWFALVATAGFLSLLLFLPGRRFEAYAYLPLAFAAIALACSSSRVNAAWAWAILAIWMPLNLHVLRNEQRTTLAMEDANYAFVAAINNWVATRPAATTLIYDGLPPGFHPWGAIAAWNIAHNGSGLAAYASSTPEAKRALANGVVAYGEWDTKNNRLVLTTRTPEP